MMERTRSRMQGTMAAIGLLVLIFDSSLALEGARSGMELCLKTVIPSLFPFFVLSMILTRSLSEYNTRPVQVLASVFGIPKAAASLVIPAVLGGYPVGAKCAGDLFLGNQISRKEAERLLAFCSNAGPSFLFGMVSGFFPDRKMVWALWFIHILSAILTAAVFSVNKEEKHLAKKWNQAENTAILYSAAKSMGMVCCWVILFRIIITFLDRWFLWLLPPWVRVLIIGILELTNGCCELLLIPDVALRFLVCSCLLSFGGVCVFFQTASVINGIYIGYYVKGKLLQTVFSFLLSFAVAMKCGPILLGLLPVLIMILRKKKNRYSNPGTIPV